MVKKVENLAIWLQKNGSKIHGHIAPCVSADNCTYFSDGVHILKICEKIPEVNNFDGVLSGFFDRYYQAVINTPSAINTVSAPDYNTVRSALISAKRDRKNQGFRRDATRYIWRVAEGYYVNAEYFLRVLQALKPEKIQCSGRGIFYCNSISANAECYFCGLNSYTPNDRDFLLN